MPLLIFLIFSLNSFFACVNNKETIENRYNGENYKIYVNKLEEIKKEEEKKLEAIGNALYNYINHNRKKNDEQNKITSLDQILKSYGEFIELKNKTEKLQNQNKEYKKTKNNSDYEKEIKMLFERKNMCNTKYSYIEYFFKNLIRTDILFANKLFNLVKEKNIIYYNFWTFIFIKETKPVN